MFLFNTYNTANGRTITPAQLEMSNSVLHPQERINLKVEVAKNIKNIDIVYKRIQCLSLRTYRQFEVFSGSVWNFVFQFEKPKRET